MGRVFNILVLCLVIASNIERLIDLEINYSTFNDVELSFEGMYSSLLIQILEKNLGLPEKNVAAQNTCISCLSNS